MPGSPMRTGVGSEPGASQRRRRRSEEHTSELQSLRHLVCRLLLERYGDHRDLHSFPTRRSSDLHSHDDACRGHPCGLELVPNLVRLKEGVADRKSTRLNSSHLGISYAVFCLKDTATTEIYTLSLHDALPIFIPMMMHAGVTHADWSWFRTWCVSKKASPPNWFANGCGRRFGQSARSGPKGSSECPRGISIASFTRRYDGKERRIGRAH